MQGASPVSEIKVHVLTADARAEQTVTTGTKAWELFQDDPQVIAARVAGVAARPQPRPAGRRRGGGRRDRQRRRSGHPAALRRARDGPGGPGALARRPSSASDHRSRTASTTTSTSRCRSSPRTSRRSRPGCARSSRRASASPAGRSPTAMPSTSSGRALQARAHRPQGVRQRRGRGRGRRRRGRCRRADHLRQRPPQRRRRRGATCAAARTCRPRSGSRRSS